MKRPQRYYRWIEPKRNQLCGGAPGWTHQNHPLVSVQSTKASSVSSAAQGLVAPLLPGQLENKSLLNRLNLGKKTLESLSEIKP